MEDNIIRVADRFRPIRKKRQRQISQYDRYSLPFFNRDALCTWDVRQTGDYAADGKTGQDYAIALIESCDGTNGWSSLLQNIVADMVRAGPTGTFPDGHPRVNGIVIGFMGVIGRAMCASISHACRPRA
jgi:hypothetical protein